MPVMLSPLDLHHLLSWYNLRGERGDWVSRLNRFRQRHPAVFAEICRTDTEAAGIAVQRGWPVGDRPQGERSPEEMEHARQTVATTLNAIAAAKVPRP